jgi:hypothetical protein
MFELVTWTGMAERTIGIRFLTARDAVAFGVRCMAAGCTGYSIRVIEPCN